MSKTIRTDKWQLSISSEQRHWMKLTIQEYRAYCRALSVVILNNWPQLQQAKSFCSAVERLIHPTKKHPDPRHHYFHRRFYKFPSYLRRAAIEFVKGQVSSYLSRYGEWLAGNRKHPKAKPPKFNCEAGCYPALYRGKLIKFDDHYQRASIKIWNGSDWVWTICPIRSKRKRHEQGDMMSPMLIVTDKEQHLSVPFNLRPEHRRSGLVCAVDMGINTTATMAIVDEFGTVVARTFFHPAIDIDRRNRQLTLIRKSAAKTKNLSQGFCKHRYRKAANYNRQIAQITSRAIVDFAKFHGADTLVIENMKGWKPRAGRKKSNLKQKFHGWMKSAIADLAKMKFEEIGGRIFRVFPRGTSSEAFDGSGSVKRDKSRYEIATFANGKCYNCDLNASYNIAARYWALKLKLSDKSGRWLQGRSSCDQPRIPVTLSTLWEREAALHASA